MEIYFRGRVFRDGFAVSAIKMITKWLSQAARACGTFQRENPGRVGVTFDLFKVGWSFIRTGYAVKYGVDWQVLFCSFTIVAHGIVETLKSSSERVRPLCKQINQTLWGTNKPVVSSIISFWMECGWEQICALRTCLTGFHFKKVTQALQVWFFWVTR